MSAIRKSDGFQPGNLFISFVQRMVLFHKGQHIFQTALNAQIQAEDACIPERLQFCIGLLLNTGNSGVNMNCLAGGKIFMQHLENVKEPAGL